MSGYRDEVLTNILGLQAELRGDEPGEPEGTEASVPPDPSKEPEAADGEGTVAVTEEGLTVSVSPAPAGGLDVSERLAALTERLAQLERDLTGVTGRIERIEPDPQMDDSANADADVDGRSFLDLQKIVADRLDRR